MIFQHRLSLSNSLNKKNRKFTQKYFRVIGRREMRYRQGEISAGRIVPFCLCSNNNNSELHQKECLKYYKILNKHSTSKDDIYDYYSSIENDRDNEKRKNILKLKKFQFKKRYSNNKEKFIKNQFFSENLHNDFDDLSKDKKNLSKSKQIIQLSKCLSNDNDQQKKIKNQREFEQIYSKSDTNKEHQNNEAQNNPKHDKVRDSEISTKFIQENELFDKRKELNIVEIELNLNKKKFRQKTIYFNCQKEMASSIESSLDHSISLKPERELKSMIKNEKNIKKCLQFSQTKPIVIDYCQESEDEDVIVHVSTNQEIDYDENSEERSVLRELTDTNTRFNSNYSNFKIQSYNNILNGNSNNNSLPTTATPIKFVIQSGTTRQPLSQPSKLKNSFLEPKISKNNSINNNNNNSSNHHHHHHHNNASTTKSIVRPQAQPPNRPPPPPPLPPINVRLQTELDVPSEIVKDSTSINERIQIDKIDLDKIRIPRASIGLNNIVQLSKEILPIDNDSLEIKERDKQILILESAGGSILTIQSNDFDDTKHDSISDSGSDSGASGLDPSRSPSQSPTQEPDNSVEDSTSSCSLESALHDNSFGDTSAVLSDNESQGVEFLPKDKELLRESLSGQQNQARTITTATRGETTSVETLVRTGTITQKQEIISLKSEKINETPKFNEQLRNENNNNVIINLATIETIIDEKDNNRQSIDLSERQIDQILNTHKMENTQLTLSGKNLNNKTTININYSSNDLCNAASSYSEETSSNSTSLLTQQDSTKLSRMLNSLAAELEMHRSNDQSQQQILSTIPQTTVTSISESRRAITFSDPKLLRDCFAGDSDSEKETNWKSTISADNEDTPKKSKLFSFGRGKAKQIKADSDTSDSEYEGLADEIQTEDDKFEQEVDSQDSDLDSEEESKKRNDKKKINLLKNMKNMKKKTTKFWTVTTKKIVDKSKFGDTKNYHPSSSSSSLSLSQENNFKSEMEMEVSSNTSKDKKKKKPLVNGFANAFKNFEDKIKNSKIANDISNKILLDTPEVKSTSEALPSFRRLNSTIESTSASVSSVEVNFTNDNFKRLDSKSNCSSIPGSIFSSFEGNENDEPPKAPIRRKKLAKKRNEMLDELKAQESKIPRSKINFENFMKSYDFEPEMMSQFSFDSKNFFTTQKVYGSDREFIVLVGTKDLHWMTGYDASNSGTMTIQNYPCRILPGDFDEVITMSNFVQQILLNKDNKTNSSILQTLVDSVVCQLFSIMSQYEFLNCHKRMIGDFKQTLIARSSHDIILLVPFITNPQTDPNYSETEEINSDFGVLSMTQAYNVQYYCLSILKALSRLGSGHYASLQERIKRGFASPNDLNILFCIDCFISAKNLQDIERFFSEDHSKKSIYSMIDYLRVCFAQSGRLALAIQLVQKDCV